MHDRRCKYSGLTLSDRFRDDPECCCFPSPYSPILQRPEHNKLTTADIVVALDQDKSWTTADGRALPLEEMSVHHVANLIKFLERRAAHLNAVAWQLFFDAFDIDDPSDGVFSIMCRLEAELMQSPLAWLHNKPLMKRLCQLDTRTPAQRKITTLRNKTYKARKALHLT